MNDKQYIEAAKRTLSLQFNTDKVSDVILHSALGICTEAGELADPIKKALFYGHAIDKVNLVEECGDILWYMAILLDELNVSFEDVKRINIAKLAERYKGEFTTEAAIVRDLNAERELIERKIRGTDQNGDLFEADEQPSSNKAEWARVFNVWQKNMPNEQVLFVHGFDSENDQYTVTVTFMNDELNARVDARLSFDDDKVSQQFFDRVATEDGARRVIQSRDIRVLFDMTGK